MTNGSYEGFCVWKKNNTTLVVLLVLLASTNTIDDWLVMISVYDY